MFQAEDGIRDLVRSLGLGDVYKRQALFNARIGVRGPDEKWGVELWAQNIFNKNYAQVAFNSPFQAGTTSGTFTDPQYCLLYTSDAADERSSVDLGGPRIIKQKENKETRSIEV